MTRTSKLTQPLSVLAILAVGGMTAGCGSGAQYKNDPRPPAPVNVTAFISNARVVISPARLGAGPIHLIVTNQSDNSHQLTIQSNELGASRPGLTQSTGPINPQGTANITVDVTPGTYNVGVDAHTIRAATLVVGRSRPSSQNQLLQP
jgi:hypothetical protein